MALVGVVGLAAPAWAHHPVTSGQTSCSEGVHVITWTIANGGQMQPRPAMTITSATAAIDGTPYSVTGYAPTVSPDGSTNAQTIVPGNMTGTVDLTVGASWPDNIKATASASVALESPCPTETTTTTEPTTTTTDATTTTTVKKSVVVEAGGVENTTTTSTVAAAAADNGSGLPFTGSSTLLPMAGVIALCAGLAMTVRYGRRRRRSI